MTMDEGMREQKGFTHSERTSERIILKKRPKIRSDRGSGASKTHTFLHKKRIVCRTFFKCEVSRKIKKFYRELEHFDKQHRIFVPSGELYNNFLQNSSIKIS